MVKAGNLFILPANSNVWSTSHQANISFEKEEIIKITARYCGNGEFCFAELQQLLFNIPGQIPTLIRKGSGEISLDVKDLKIYEVPKPHFIEMIYGKEK